MISLATASIHACVLSTTKEKNRKEPHQYNVSESAFFFLFDTFAAIGLLRHFGCYRDIEDHV